MELIDLKTELREELKNAFDVYSQQLSMFSEQELNRKPVFGGWTAGQVTDHISKAVDGLPDGSTTKAERPFDLHVETLKGLFLDFNTKMNAPEFVHPSDGPFAIKSQLERLAALKHENLEFITSRDLEEVCLDFEVPFMGFLTRYEWLHFFNVHLQRHCNQLKNIYKSVHKQ
ncbi:DinB family protein [Solitalea canadensis]|uniref:DinB-like domain-containing protein n=1 Tax=Solitalea canadensis (strain ATCC 29591 / DSM 3403 / JCM 21819 / LMG 8368 / NBRC 15130 / NCIMB 12057 / USAM 9D) TaxID=929556 RepID=H8KNF3_SOLCM|nr:DinB family protein [Solitalea canadensis]AFD07951.1 Protein of unknown function (DUF1569) [Solitalea canadensis DSM 3403]